MTEPKTSGIWGDYEEAARYLETSADHRVMRRARVPAPLAALPAGASVAAIVDSETTGTDPKNDEAVEIAILSFAHRDGKVLGSLGRYVGLQEPSKPMCEEAQAMTGLTGEMLAGRRFDPIAMRAGLAGATLMIAHKAGFDHPFVTAAFPELGEIPWACSLDEVDWRGRGDGGRRLEDLLSRRGMFCATHRAEPDCEGLYALLASAEGEDASILGELLSTASKVTARIHAIGAPYAAKDVLKAKGYRWNGGEDGKPKAWWKQVDQEEIPAERELLAKLACRNPTVETFDATTRHRCP